MVVPLGDTSLGGEVEEADPEEEEEDEEEAEEDEDKRENEEDDDDDDELDDVANGEGSDRDIEDGGFAAGGGRGGLLASGSLGRFS